MRRVVVVVVVVLGVVLLLGAAPAGVEFLLGWRYGNEVATSVAPPIMSLGEPYQNRRCAGFSDDQGAAAWQACDADSQIAAEYHVYEYTHRHLTTPLYVRTGIVDGIMLPTDTSLLEYCGRTDEPCEFWELIGHRGRG